MPGRPERSNLTQKADSGCRIGSRDGAQTPVSLSVFLKRSDCNLPSLSGAAFHADSNRRGKTLLRRRGIETQTAEFLDARSSNALATAWWARSRPFYFQAGFQRVGQYRASDLSRLARQLAQRRGARKQIVIGTMDSGRSFICKARSIDRSIVFGHSMGGIVAMLYAIRHPNHLLKLVLSSTSTQPVGRTFFCSIQAAGWSKRTYRSDGFLDRSK